MAKKTGNRRPGRASMTAEGLAAYLERNPAAARRELVEALAGVRSGTPATAQDLRQALGLAGVRQPPSARPKGSSMERVQDIIASIRACVPMGSMEEDAEGVPVSFSLWLAGARLMTYNQTISTFQRRLPQYFRYKSALKKATAEAMGLAHVFQEGAPPLFRGQVIIEVLRCAPREMDRDGVDVLFKVLIDMLRHKQHRVIRDDNPDIVVDVVKHQMAATQASGRIGVGLRVRAVSGWRKPPVPDPIADWHVHPA